MSSRELTFADTSMKRACAAWNAADGLAHVEGLRRLRRLLGLRHGAAHQRGLGGERGLGGDQLRDVSVEHAHDISFRSLV